MQKGFNLISLMMGTTISLISMLAMLSLYKNLVGISVVSIQDAKQDGQIAASLLTAEQELRNAGFRIDPDAVAISDRIVLLDGAALSNGLLAGNAVTLSATAATGNAMVWIYKTATNGNASCAGLLVQDGQLSRLQSASGCTQLSQRSSTSWVATPLIESGQTAEFFSARYANCWPFGKTAEAAGSTTRVQVTMTAITSTIDAGSSASQPAYVKSNRTVCLPNLQNSQ